MEKIRIGWIIHTFALLHAAVALLCIRTGVEDELLLTILTIAMALLICMRKRFNVEFTAVSIIVVNIIGYLLGTAGASIFSHILNSPFATHAISTAITTEILGWSIVAVSKTFNKGKEDGMTSPYQFYKWIIIAVAATITIRIGMILLVSGKLITQKEMMRAVLHVFSSSFALITMLCLNVIYIRVTGHINKKLSTGSALALLTCYIIISSALGSCLCSIGITFNLVIHSWIEFLSIFIVTLICQTGMYCIVYVVSYAITAGNRMQEEKEKKHIAQYRYQKLKRQVNPHFLFNSLNALDYIVREEKTEQASTYIHKLAGIYRYMIKSEEDVLVPLADELKFVEMYIDLLKVRFPEGFEVRFNIREEDMARFVLPCSVQLLIENVTKHNTVGADNPLIINVTSDGNDISVSNNIVPKLTLSPSTGLGQKYLRQQYMDLSGKYVQINKTENEYCVILPLL